MTPFELFDRNARTNGILVDTNLIILLIVGSVNRDRVPRFKRTSGYTPEDRDLLTGILEQVSRRYTLPHVLAQVSDLIDLRLPELATARFALHRLISILRELQVPSADAAASPLYVRLGLTDAAIVTAARPVGCSVLTNDSGLYTALLADGLHVVRFDDLRNLL